MKKNNINIGIIFPRFTGPYGGERLLINLANNLSLMGSEVTVYTHSHKEIDISHYKRIQFVEGFYPKTKNHNIASLLDLLLMPFLARKIKNDYDIILCIGWQSLFGAYVYKKLVSKNQKVIYYCLEPPRLAYDLKKNTVKNKNFFKKIFLNLLIATIGFIDKYSISSVDEIISISEWTDAQVRKIYNRNTKIIYPGVEVERFNHLSTKEAKQILHLPKNQRIFLSVSKLHKRKRLDLAIKVFEKNKDKNSLFFIIGDGPDKQKIQQSIKKTNDPNIFLLGKLPDKEIVRYMKAADYFIFTAKNEPFGIAPLEAAVSGCKVIPDGIKYKPTDWKTVARDHINYYEKFLYATPR